MNRALLLGLALLGSLFLTPGARAQMRGGGQPFWKYTSPNGGIYEVALRMITSISIQVYYVEGGIQITELSVDTLGNTEGRFYAMQSGAQAAAAGMGGPAGTVAQSVQSHGQDAVAKAGSIVGGTAVDSAVNTSVVKNYPTTTHAHTVEYRLGTPEEVTALFNSLEASWKSNTNATYPPPAATTPSS